MDILAGGPGLDLYDLALRDARAAPPGAMRRGGVTARDLVVLLAAAAHGRASWSAAQLARELGVPALEVSMGLERARRVGLIDSEKRRVSAGPLLEFLLHGLRYVFPAEVGRTSRGVATAQLAGRFVWPSDEGDAAGRSLTPLDAAAVGARGAGLRELLSLVDTLRVGEERERAIAARELSRRLELPGA